MELDVKIFNSYFFIILVSVIIIISYLYNVISKKTNIPSVLLLIVTGIGINQAIQFFNLPAVNWFPILEILGIVGLIMIVLEAALDLELKKEKWPIIWKSLVVALMGLIGGTFIAAYIIQFYYEVELINAILYAIPLSVLSSAIVLPSVASVRPKAKEFMIYESTFSDILGIMVFYFAVGLTETTDPGGTVLGFFGNLLLTVAIAVLASYILIFVFQNIKSHVKLFLLIAILLLLYSIGKLFHLSSLIIILVFGLVMNNHRVFFRSFLLKWLNVDKLKKTLEDFKVVTIESAFLVRTFFFVIFGVTIALSSLWDINVFIISLIILVTIYVLRFTTMKPFVKRISPQLFVAPRGLITVLLFYAIPENASIPDFDAGILLYIILLTNILMTIALIQDGKKQEVYDEMFEGETVNKDQVEGIIPATENGNEASQE